MRSKQDVLHGESGSIPLASPIGVFVPVFCPLAIAEPGTLLIDCLRDPVLKDGGMSSGVSLGGNLPV